MLETKGLFYGVGHSPNSQLLDGQVELDRSGYVLVEGLFAAGDVQVILSRVSFLFLQFSIGPGPVKICCVGPDTLPKTLVQMLQQFNWWSSYWFRNCIDYICNDKACVY